MKKAASFWWPWPWFDLPGGISTKWTCRFCVRNGSSPGPMRHQVRESFESPEWPTFASSTTTSSLRTRGASSCASLNSLSPYCSELIPRKNTRPLPIGPPCADGAGCRRYHNCLTISPMSAPRANAEGMFAPITFARASSAIADQIRAAIIGGQLKEGERLPPERSLAEQFAVSRVTVRDALRALEAMGLITVRVGARGGAFVTAPTGSVVAQTMSDMVMM